MVLRVAGYLDNRSLWFDEAALSINLIGASFGDLLRPFSDPVQFAPPGFLILQKMVISVLGNGEHALRLVPLIAGCVALPLFHGAARTFLRPWAVMVGLAILAVSHPLIYHASEAKQYSLDVALACGLLWSAAVYCRTGLTVRLAIVWGITGAMAVWLSFPAAFLLVGMGIVVGISSLRQKDPIARISILFIPWGASAIALYLISIRHVVMQEWLLDYWGHGFVPFSFVSFTLPKWAGYGYLEMIGMAGIILPGIGALAYLIGLGSIHGRDRKMLLLLLAPLGMAVLASALRRYPLHERLVLFTTPITVLLVAEGIDAVMRRARGWGIILLALLCLPPALRAADHLLFDPHRREELREVMEYAVEQAEPDDAWYVYHGAAHAFRYYQQRLGVPPDRVIHGGDADLAGLPGKGRVWVVFSHYQSVDGLRDEDTMTELIEEMGRSVDQAMAPGASVYLYDLGER